MKMKNEYLIYGNCPQDVALKFAEESFQECVLGESIEIILMCCEIHKVLSLKQDSAISINKNPAQTGLKTT